MHLFCSDSGKGRSPTHKEDQSEYHGHDDKAGVREVASLGRPHKYPHLRYNLVCKAILSTHYRRSEICQQLVE